MKSKAIGSNISDVEVSNISPHGIWIIVGQTESFLSYDEHPWLREAAVGKIFNLELLHGHHLHWPELDIDIDLETLGKTESFPLVYEA